MKVIIIILNWNGLDNTLECLESLKKIYSQDWDYQTVVVDNGSTDDSVAVIKKKFPEVVILANQDNLGFAAGNNVAFEWAKKQGADYCLLLNNDTIVQDRSVDILVRYAKSRPKLGAAIPVINYYNNKEVWYAGGKVIRPFWRLESFKNVLSSQPYESELFSGCAALIPVRVLHEVGLFDPRYYLYLEDADLALRISKAGYHIWVVPQANVFHKVSQSSGGDKAPDPIYYQIRNNLLLIKAKSKSIFEQLLGYTYMFVLTGKILLNIVILNLPQKKALIRSLIQGWLDFAFKRWGKRS